MLAALLLCSVQDLLIDLDPTPLDFIGDSNPRQFVESSGRLFFIARAGEPDFRLWSMDDLAAIPTPVPDLTGGLAAGLNVENWMVPFDGGVLYQAPTSSVGTALWFAGGTTPGARVLLETHPVGPQFGLQPLGEHLGQYYVERLADAAVLRTDGTPAGTLVVLDAGPAYREFAPLVTLAGETYSIASTQPGSADLVRLDLGTDAWGKIATLSSAFGSDPDELVAFNSRLWMTDFDNAGTELWSSDGTTLGTGRFADLAPGTGSSFPRDLTSNGTRLWFSARESSTGRELWTSDGTVAGTTIVLDALPGSASSDPEDFEPYPGGLALSGVFGSVGREPPLTDGTPGGSLLIGPNLVPGTSPFLEVEWQSTASGLLLSIGEGFEEQLFLVDGAGSATRLKSPGGFGFNAATSLGVFEETGLVSGHTQAFGAEPYRS